MKVASQANRGKAFEDYLRLVHDRYQRLGTAVVHKVPTEFIPLRDGTGRVVNAKVERKSCVDYLGRYGSIPIAVEAKHTATDGIRFDRVEDHQADFLDDFTRDPGAVGIVLVSFGMTRFFAIPWRYWGVWRKECKRTPTGARPASFPLKCGRDFADTPARRHIKPGDLPVCWEIKDAGLPYLEIIDRWR